MSSESESPEPTSGDRGGVFGNLPSERPGVRSPRREGEDRRPAAKPAGAKKAARSGPAPASPSRPRPRKAPPPPPPEPSPRSESSEPPPAAGAPQEPPSSRKGIEDVAWAGVTVAAEAATLGVRLFSRALEAVRERR
jgi:hypothetical protein